MIVQLILYFFIIVVGTLGEICVSRAMKTLGEVKDFRPLALGRFILRALGVGWMWLGLALMTVAFFALLGILSLANVSLVIPVSALSYAVGTLAAATLLRERVSARRWAGVLVVCAGVALVLVA